MTKQKGFTLIELLVVIAIIGILAGILFIAINPKEQTDKAKLASIKSTMAQIPTQAAMKNAESFDNACTDTADLINSVKNTDGVTTDVDCTDGPNGFVFQVHLNDKDNTKVCVDASGVKEGKDGDATNLKCN